MKGKVFKGLLFVAALMAPDWSVKRALVWWDQFRDVIGPIQESRPIEVACRIEEKQAGERKVVGKTVISDRVHANIRQLRAWLCALFKVIWL